MRDYQNELLVCLVGSLLATIAVFLLLLGLSMVGCQGGGETEPWYHLDCYVEGDTIVVDVQAQTHGVTFLTCKELDMQETFTEDSTFEFPAVEGTYTFIVEYEKTDPTPRHVPFDMSFPDSPDNSCVVEVEETVVPSNPEIPSVPESPPWENDNPCRWGHRKVAVCYKGRTRCLPIPSARNLFHSGRATLGRCK